MNAKRAGLCGVFLCSAVAGRVENLPDWSGGQLETVAKSLDRQWTAVAVSSTGRVFVSYPRWMSEYENAVEELRPDGSNRPFPDRAWNEFIEGREDPGRSFVCVQSVYADDKDRLWVLDPASPNMQGVAPGGAKLLEVDLEEDRVRRVIRFDESIAPHKSYLNDVRVDTRRGYAYITDSGLGAIIVVDLATGRPRRVLARHESTKAEHGFVPLVQGQRLLRADTGEPMRVNSDGIALDTRGEYLYWQALTGKTLYRVATEVLRDSAAGRREIERAVERLGETVVTDGMEIDGRGNVYFTALEHDAIVFRTPYGELRTLVADPRIAWPDSMALTREGDLYFTTSQIHRTQWLTGSMPSEPYYLFRTRIPEVVRAAERR